MVKKIHIQAPDDEPFWVIGLVSHEKIWKLSWEINRIFDLQLTHFPQFSPPDTKNPAQTEGTSLLPESPETDLPPGYYKDHQSMAHVVFVLFSQEGRRIPKPVKAFPYFFAASGQLDVLANGISHYIEALKASNWVLSAVDLSNIKHINQIIP